MTTECSWSKRVYTQLYSCGGRSSTRIPSISRAVHMQHHSCSLKLIPHQCSTITSAYEVLKLQDVFKLFSELSTNPQNSSLPYSLLLSTGASKLTQITFQVPWPHRCFLKLKSHNLDLDHVISNPALWLATVRLWASYSTFLSFSFLTWKMPVMTVSTHKTTVKHT